MTGEIAPSPPNTHIHIPLIIYSFMHVVIQQKPLYIRTQLQLYPSFQKAQLSQPCFHLIDHILLFPEKEAKSVVLLRRSPRLIQRFKLVDNTLLFLEKEAKSISSASLKIMGYPTLGEADPSKTLR
jgi:hypothetical protein